MCRFFSVDAIYHHLPAVLRVVNEITCTEEPNSETAVDATGLKAQFVLDPFWFCLTSSKECQKQLRDFFSGHKFWFGTSNQCYCWIKRNPHDYESNWRIKDWDDALVLIMVKISSGGQGTPRKPLLMVVIYHKIVLWYPTTEQDWRFGVQVCNVVPDTISELEGRFSP